MEEKTTSIKTLIEKVEVYLKSNIDLLELKAIDKSANMGASVISSLVILFAILCIIMMANIGLAIWVGDLIGSLYCGFFIVAAFYAVVTITFFYFRKPLIEAPLSNLIINQMRPEKTD